MTIPPCRIARRLPTTSVMSAPRERVRPATPRCTAVPAFQDAERVPGSASVRRATLHSRPALAPRRLRRQARAAILSLGNRFLAPTAAQLPSSPNASKSPTPAYAGSDGAAWAARRWTRERTSSHLQPGIDARSQGLGRSRRRDVHVRQAVATPATGRHPRGPRGSRSSCCRPR